MPQQAKFRGRRWNRYIHRHDDLTVSKWPSATLDLKKLKFKRLIWLFNMRRHAKFLAICGTVAGDLRAAYKTAAVLSRGATFSAVRVPGSGLLFSNLSEIPSSNFRRTINMAVVSPLGVRLSAESVSTIAEGVL